MKSTILIFLLILVTILVSSSGAVFAVEKNIVSSSSKAAPFHAQSDRYSAVNKVLSGDDTGKKEPMLLALNCIKPIKPILPIKPIWCTGEWKLVLQCDQYCNCVWIPMCLE